MQLPRITIVTPSFNQAKYLPETIESILSQDYPNLEYIVIDGGSTDGSVDIIKKYESRLSYWVSEKDNGQSDAIMKGFERSTGELFAWVNSDDVLFPGCLHRIASTYIGRGQPDIIHSDVAYLNSEGRIIRFVRTPAQNLFLCSRGVWYAQAPAVFFKSRLFRQTGGLNRNYHLSMDFDIWVRMMKAGALAAHVPYYLGGFRWHKSSKTVQFSEQSEKPDNPEAAEICRLQLPGLTRSQRIFWQYILKVYRLLNLNYLRAYKDLRNIGGSKKWQEIFNRPSVSNGGNGTMKFLLVTPAYEPAWEYGGVVASNSNLCRAMAELGVSVTVYTTNASKGSKPLDVPLGVPVNVGGVSVYYFNSTFGPDNNFCSRDLTNKLWQTVSEFDIVYVVALWQWIGIEAARACQKMKVPMVVAIKGGFSKRLLLKSYIKKKLFWLLFLRRALKRATAIHLSGAGEKAAGDKWLDKLPIMYLPNPVPSRSRNSFTKKQSSPGVLYSPDPIDPKKYDLRDEEHTSFRKKYGIPEDAPVLISVARPSWEKRIDLLIGALAHDKEWRLVFAGEHSSGMGPQWKRYAEKLGVADRIIWTGFLSGRELNEALISADLFALVSESESFGMVVVEAMMCGLPVMISKDVGVWEEIKNEPFVILAEKSVDSVVQGMSSFREKMSNSLIDLDYIKQVAINKFSPQVVADNFITKLHELISKDKAVSSHLISQK